VAHGISCWTGILVPHTDGEEELGQIGPWWTPDIFNELLNIETSNFVCISMV